MIKLTGKNVATIRSAHSELYAKFLWQSDSERTGRTEFWEDVSDAFDGKGRVYGDCDEFAIAMQAKLWELFPEHKESFRIACVFVEESAGGGGHAICLIDAEKLDSPGFATFAAENRWSYLISWDSLKEAGYTPWCIQKNAESLREWVAFE